MSFDDAKEKTKYLESMNFSGTRSHYEWTWSDFRLMSCTIRTIECMTVFVCFRCLDILNGSDPEAS